MRPRRSAMLYGAGGWNQQAILNRLQFARDWADEHHVLIICDEFGAYRNTAPPDSRARYIHDVRSDLEALHIGWSMWDYRGNFGLMRRNGTGKPSRHRDLWSAWAGRASLAPFPRVRHGRRRWP